MPKHRTKSRFDLRTASVPALKAKLEQAQQDLSRSKLRVEELRAQVASIPSDATRIDERVTEIDREITNLKKGRRPRPGLLGSVLGLTTLPQEVKSKISWLETDRFMTEFGRDGMAHRSHRLTDEVERVARLESWTSRLEEALRKHERRSDRLVQLKAAAAATSDASRRVAASVRLTISQQPWCPYCGGSLGDSPHLDHIYPIAKGGRSVPRNMVWACSGCNNLKRDLTLTGFIGKHKLDREAIEARLEALGKEF